ncbi:hypothetical protein SAMN05660657_03795 [Geodermatophilus amargosae]|uniref:Uncharacterized protein n=1 Tax=Geodermatophilus amargosae TaxID=1296565 RepID=A0A1I7BRT5_9ACTN|nr:hypothetical protein [Geodermatophilus amargosae]SFT89811.1 hypothetical protein SAMN05660657_03795 [Geodermatophilus amargosae]
MTAVFTGSSDDAALFPPGDVPTAAAVPGHRELSARLGDLVGRFVVPAARPRRADPRTSGDGDPFDVSVVAAARAALAAPDDAVPAGVPAAVEVPRTLTCTAGLHSAVRHTDPVTGSAHHGFLDVLLATGALLAGEPAAVAVDRLGESDAGAIVSALRSWPADRWAQAWAVLTSFGTCSVLEPVDDLVALGLLPAPDRIPA